jgi:hypothetical protein
MGPILQYIIGVPVALVCLIGGPFAAYCAFTNLNQPQNNGIGSGLVFLILGPTIGIFLLKAIFFDGLYGG